MKNQHQTEIMFRKTIQISNCDRFSLNETIVFRYKQKQNKTTTKNKQ